MKCTISTLLWLLLVTASFLAGFTAQSITEPVVPVLIASKNLDEETFLTPKHFLVVHRRASTLPYGVLSDPADVDRKRAKRKIWHGQYVLPGDIDDQISSVSIQKGHSVIAIKVSAKTNSLALHLFSRGDRVSLWATEDNHRRELLLESVHVFTAGEFDGKSDVMVGLVVDDDQKSKIVAVTGGADYPSFGFDRPVNAE